MYRSSGFWKGLYALFSYIVAAGNSKKKLKNILFQAIIAIFVFASCATYRFHAQFAPLRDLPPEAIKSVSPAEVEVLTGEPPIGTEYYELGYIIYEDAEMAGMVTLFKKEKDIIELIRKTAAEHGADAVIKFQITGEESGERKAKGMAIVYKK